MSIINLMTPIGSERVRAGFQPHWRTMFKYRCAQGHVVRVYASAFQGKTPVPGVGGITCPQCELNGRVTE